MVDKQYFKDRVFAIQGQSDFRQLALELFAYQAKNNHVYQSYLDYLHIDVNSIESLSEIPFLPISFFKTQRVQTGNYTPQKVFTSSGTGGRYSKHLIGDIAVYEESFNRAFKKFYGHAADWCILALLPSYLEREGSSLIYMAQSLIQQSDDADSNFYLNQWDALKKVLDKKKEERKKTLLLGVSFGLLDFIEHHRVKDFPELTVMETGGMKGRRKEVIRAELHHSLKLGFGVKSIHSEYGMTELLSQAYSAGDGRFFTPPWMQVLIRQTDDPFSATRPGKTGGINVVDLANIDSCAFIETQDLGRIYKDGSFEVMGRFDNSDIRGCNLMVI